MIEDLMWLLLRCIGVAYIVLCVTAVLSVISLLIDTILFKCKNIRLMENPVYLQCTKYAMGAFGISGMIIVVGLTILFVRMFIIVFC